ncbi:MAG: hypothetical protein OK455_10765 [Thaumarchaeota archaeon]|nr:hypothetical protein [Nitrososphaerota archaeon]
MDLLLAVLVLYASFWVYEIGNYLSLMLSGGNAALDVSGILPVGTTAVSTSHTWMPTALAKMIQVAFSVSLMLLVARRARRMHFSVLEGAAICVISLFGASLYWESLTLVSMLSLEAHEILYIAATVAVQFGLMRAMKYSPFSGDY